MRYPAGLRAKERIRKGQEQLETLVEILHSERVEVKSVKEFDDEFEQELHKMKTNLKPQDTSQDIRTKKAVETFRPTPLKPKQYIKTPFWESNYMYGVANPRDCVLILGNTIVEAPMSHRCRYFESYAYRDCLQ
jgi:N-dimethylarginine dimethylaminohydrolase